MVSGRGGDCPNITYRYTVQGETYVNTWLTQFDYRNCAAVPARINIIYLENDPASSIVGSTSERSNGSFMLFALSAVGFGLGLTGRVKHALTYLPAVLRWRRQQSSGTLLPGEIVAVLSKTGSHTEITYHFESPEGCTSLGKTLLDVRNLVHDGLPKPGQRVVVLYFDDDNVTIA
jgi:hypothetical protein